jgi:hypothetical protein
MLVLPKLIYRFHTILTKSPVSYLVNIDKMILKPIGRSKLSQAWWPIPIIGAFGKLRQEDWKF